jgi:hypothetical protein
MTILHTNKKSPVFVKIVSNEESRQRSESSVKNCLGCRDFRDGKFTGVVQPAAEPHPTMVISDRSISPARALGARMPATTVHPGPLLRVDDGFTTKMTFLSSEQASKPWSPTVQQLSS